MILLTTCGWDTVGMGFKAGQKKITLQGRLHKGRKDGICIDAGECTHLGQGLQAANVWHK